MGRIKYNVDTNFINIPCNKCGRSQNYSIPELETAFAHALEHEAENMIRVVVLIDCSNAHATVHAAQTRAVDRSTKIALGYIRDYLAEVCLTFIDAGFNLADAGAKKDASRNIWLQCVEANLFRIGFVGRENTKILKKLTSLFVGLSMTQ